MSNEAPGSQPRPKDLTAEADLQRKLQKIREGLETTLEAPHVAEKQAHAVLRRIAGAPASSIVRSAEGFTQFDGLQQNGNGLLSTVARNALRAEIGNVDELLAPPPHTGSESPTASASSDEP